MADKLSVSDGVTNVYQAARDGFSDLTDLLKRLKTEQRKSALETKIKDGSHFVTPLIIAAHNGHLNSVKILLGYGADIEARGTLKVENEVIEGCTPLWAAAASGRLDVVKLLIEENAEVDGRTSTGSTPLRVAAHEGHLDIVRCLVESGADVNARSRGDSSSSYGSLLLWLFKCRYLSYQQRRLYGSKMQRSEEWQHCTSLRCSKGPLGGSSSTFSSRSITAAR